MKNLKTERLDTAVSTKIVPFFEEMLGSAHRGNIHSFHLVGSALRPDFDEKNSAINSVIVLNDMDLGFVEYLAPLGKRYKKKGIRIFRTDEDGAISISSDGEVYNIKTYKGG